VEMMYCVNCVLDPLSQGYIYKIYPLFQSCTTLLGPILKLSVNDVNLDTDMSYPVIDGQS